MKNELKKKVLDGMRPPLVDELKRKIATGEIKPPIGIEATAEGVWKAVQENPMTNASTIYLDITLEDIMTVVRDVFEELRVEVR